MSLSALYDAPGPQTKRRVLIGSLIAGLALLVVFCLVVLQLDKQGQLAASKWSPLLYPGDEVFGAVWNLIGQALGNTLIAASLAMVFSLVIGTMLAVARITSAAWYRWAVVGLIHLLRGVPVVIVIFFAARVLPEFGIELSTLWFLVIGLTAYNSVIIAEIVRTGVASLPHGQQEAADSLGLTRSQVLRMILLPQAFRVMMPALISQLTVVLKDTSLGFIISYQELARTGQILIQNLNNPIQTYLVVAVIFILINYVLGRFAIYVERRLSRGKKTTALAKASKAALAKTGAAT